MASDIFTIGASGVRAAKAALDLTAQNIANANTEGYTRRTLDVRELSGNGTIARTSAMRLGGVLIEGAARTESAFLQAEARRTGSDAARATAQLDGLRVAERALESSGLFAALTEFEAGLAQLANDPLSAPLRGQVIENGRIAAESFNLAARGLTSAQEDVAFQANADIERANVLTAELARTNTNIARTREGSSARLTLLDQRDLLINELSGIAGVAARFDQFGRAEVRLGDGTGPLLVSGDTSATLAASSDADGRISYTLDGAGVAPSAGRLSGAALAADGIADRRAQLDAAASRLATLANDAQGAGAPPTGTTGAPFFSGTTASTIALALTDGAGIATAPAGSPANSRNIGNLSDLRDALADSAGPGKSVDNLLFSLSSEISGRNITEQALAAFAASAAAALSQETAIDLDQEAAELIRFQQAFQASSRLIESARNIFDTILSIRP